MDNDFEYIIFSSLPVCCQGHEHCLDQGHFTRPVFR